MIWCSSLLNFGNRTSSPKRVVISTTTVGVKQAGRRKAVATNYHRPEVAARSTRWWCGGRGARGPDDAHRRGDHRAHVGGVGRQHQRGAFLREVAELRDVLLGHPELHGLRSHPTRDPT